MSTRQSIESTAAASPQESVEPRIFGRYVLYAPIARGGMATIHIARLVGDDGFSRIVAAKRLHPQFTEDPEFVAMFRDEAEIASKIHHPNVVPVLDIVLAGEEVVLVQEYVHGVPLDRLFRAARMAREAIPPRIVVAIMSGVLAGLHSAHETTDERGDPLGIVHRDVSPQNVMVSVDGIPRLLDFGIAKATSSVHVTRAGLLKGKIAYMAPEQVRGVDVSRASDIYACGVVLWELLALQRLHAGRGEAEILSAVMKGDVPALTAALEPMRATTSRESWSLLTHLEPVVSKAIAVDPQHRYATAAEMLGALVRVVPAASAHEVSEWVKGRCGDYLERRQQVLAANEDSWRSLSKIAVANVIGSGAGEGPQSGVSRVRAESGVVSTVGPALTASPSQIMYISAEPPETRRARLVPWAIAVASLTVSAALLGALGARHTGPVESAAPPAPAAREAAPAAPPVVTGAPEPAVAATSFLASPPAAAVAPRATRAVAPAPLPMRRAPLDALPAQRAPGPAAASPAAASPAASPAAAKVDCDPPFYFEGTKKVFKPSCI
jgi:serine/threonine-protein kinase